MISAHKHVDNIIIFHQFIHGIFWIVICLLKSSASPGNIRRNNTCESNHLRTTMINMLFILFQICEFRIIWWFVATREEGSLCLRLRLLLLLRARRRASTDTLLPPEEFDYKEIHNNLNATSYYALIPGVHTIKVAYLILAAATWNMKRCLFQTIFL